MRLAAGCFTAELPGVGECDGVREEESGSTSKDVEVAAEDRPGTDLEPPAIPDGFLFNSSASVLIPTGDMVPFMLEIQ